LQAANPAFQAACTWSTYAGKLIDREQQIIKMSETNIIQSVMNNSPQNVPHIIMYIGK
jgi:hypothetical protein